MGTIRPDKSWKAVNLQGEKVADSAQHFEQIANIVYGSRIPILYLTLIFHSFPIYLEPGGRVKLRYVTWYIGERFRSGLELSNMS